MAHLRRMARVRLIYVVSSREAAGEKNRLSRLRREASRAFHAFHYRAASMRYGRIRHFTTTAAIRFPRDVSLADACAGDYRCSRKPALPIRAQARRCALIFWAPAYTGLSTMKLHVMRVIYARHYINAAATRRTIPRPYTRRAAASAAASELPFLCRT